jgi:hypothetical protein
VARRLVTAKTELVRLRLPPRVKRSWEAAAGRAGLTLSEWLRRLADAAVTPPPPASLP